MGFTYQMVLKICLLDAPLVVEIMLMRLPLVIQEKICTDIQGNSFSKATIIVDGTTAISYKAASASIYFPQYANQFSRTIS